MDSDNGYPLRADGQELFETAPRCATCDCRHREGQPCVPPVVGGQGRTASDLINSASAIERSVRVIVYAAVVAVTAKLIVLAWRSL